MSLFKINPSALFATVVTDAKAAETIAAKATSYIVIAEQVGNAWGLKGPDKLALVKNMLLADLKQSWPAGYDWVQKAWPNIAGVISALVSIFNAISWAFEAMAPIVAAASPGAIPALTAVNAALQAVKAAGDQLQADAPPAQPQPTPTPAVVGPPADVAA